MQRGAILWCWEMHTYQAVGQQGAVGPVSVKTELQIQSGLPLLIHCSSLFSEKNIILKLYDELCLNNKNNT